MTARLLRSLALLLLGGTPAIVGCSTPSSAADPGSASDVLPGRVVLMLEDGERLEDASGSLRVTAGDQIYWKTEIAVVDGRFELPTRGGPITFVELSHGSLDGRSVIPRAESESRFEVTPGEDVLTLVCTSRGTLALEVRDARTGEPVEGVAVTRRGKLSPHPGPEPELIAEGAPASFELDPDEVQKAGGRLFVRAPGYAWTPVQLDPRGDRGEVVLEPSGSLTVRVAGVGEAEELDLFVTAAGNAYRFLQRLDEDGELRLDGLPAGPIEARVQRGPWGKDPLVFERAKGRVRAGEELALELTLDESAAAGMGRAELTLEVVVPAEWELDELTLLAGLDNRETGVVDRERRTVAPEPSGEGEPQRFLLELGPRHLGDWTIELETLGYLARVSFDGDSVPPISPPAPATLLVDVTRAGSGEPAPGARVWWRSLSGVTGSMSGVQAEPVAGVPGRFRLRAPAGPVQLHAMHPEFEDTIAVQELSSGTQTIEVELPARVGVGFRLMEGETVVNPMLWGLGIKVRRPDGELVKPSTAWSEAEGHALEGLEPGRYVAYFPTIPGYAPIEDLVFEIVEGEFVRLDVPVTSSTAVADDSVTDAPMAQLTVVLERGDTGEPLEGARVSWQPGGIENSETATLAMAEPVAGKPGHHRLDAPAGTLTLFAVHPELGATLETHGAVEGESTVKLTLASSTSVLLRLVDGTEAVTPPLWGFGVKLTAADGSAATGVGRGQRPGGIAIRGLEPGRYTATLPNLPGYEPFEPLEFEVVAGQPLELDVQVRRVE